MAKKAAVLLADGFEEIEAVTPIDILRRAGVEVLVAGISGKHATGAHGLVVNADVLATELGDDLNLLVFPGGMPGSKNLGESPVAESLAKRLHASGKLVAAICAAPVFTLGAWGLLNGKRATCYPGMEGMFPAEVAFVPERVVMDGNIITSRGPGTATEFSLSLAALVAGPEKADEIAKAIVKA